MKGGAGGGDGVAGRALDKMRARDHGRAPTGWRSASRDPTGAPPCTRRARTSTTRRLPRSTASRLARQRRLAPRAVDRGRPAPDRGAPGRGRPSWPPTSGSRPRSSSATCTSSRSSGSRRAWEPATGSRRGASPIGSGRDAGRLNRARSCSRFRAATLFSTASTTLNNLSPSQLLDHDREPSAHDSRGTLAGRPRSAGRAANRTGFRYRAYVPGPIGAWELVLPGSLAADLARAEAAVRELDRHGPLLVTLACPLLSRRSHRQLAHRRHRREPPPTRPGRTGRLGRSHRARRDRQPRGCSAVPSLLPTTGWIRRYPTRSTGALAGTGDEPRAGRVRRDRTGSVDATPTHAARRSYRPRLRTWSRSVRSLRLLRPATTCRRSRRPRSPTCSSRRSIPTSTGTDAWAALIQVILRRRGIAHTVLPPVSLVLAGARERYVEGLTAFRGATPARGSPPSTTRCSERLEPARSSRRASGRFRASGPSGRGNRVATRPSRRPLIRRLPEEPIVDLATARRAHGSERPGDARRHRPSRRRDDAARASRAAARSPVGERRPLRVTRRSRVERPGDRAGAAPDNRENLRFCGVDCGPRPRSPHKGEQRE